VHQALSAEDVMAAQRFVRQMPAGDSVADAILKLVRSARPQTEGRPRASMSCRLGAGTARQPSADDDGASARAGRRPPRAIRGRRDRDGQARAPAPHGAYLHRPHRKHRRSIKSSTASSQRSSGEARPSMSVDLKAPTSTIALEEAAQDLAAKLPALLVEARRVASTVAQGTHGRRRPGPGETFWQYRSFEQGDSATLVDWRRSAGSSHLFVREREWEAAHTVWIWLDLSPSMYSARIFPKRRRQSARSCWRWRLPRSLPMRASAWGFRAHACQSRPTVSPRP